MLIRILSGIVGALTYSFLVFSWNGVAFAVGVAVFAMLAASEFYRAVRRQGGEPTDFLGYVACVVFQFAAYPLHGAKFATFLPASLMLLVIATLLVELVKRRTKPIINIGATLLGAIYVGWMFSYLTLLRETNWPMIHAPLPRTTSGEWLLIFVTATTWLSDAGALFAGRAFGRHKMAPLISPAKTWEGSIGGLLLSMLGGFGLTLWFHMPVPFGIGLGLLCGLAGQTGDLCESALKRDLGVKDFGDVIPGHGGILDRIDSLLFSAPLAYYYILILGPLLKH